MLKKTLPFLLFLPFLFQAQKGGAELNLNNINYGLLESEFMERLNKLRSDQHLSILTSDKTLAKAAKDQADYQNQKHFLTHNQKEKIKETPQKRVFFYNGTHASVGENCIKIPLKLSFKPKYSKTAIEVKTYSEAGEALFLGWKNSPGHYKNMIDPDYDVSGLGFSFDKDSNYIYCAQVFGAKPFLPSPEFVSPGDAFGIMESIPNICNVFTTTAGKLAMANMQVIVGFDSLYLRSEDVKALKNFFTHPADAIYFDLVQRKQFVCEKNNLLHGSPVYDGKMLKPVLFTDIFKRNSVHDGLNMYAAICPTPPQLKDKVQLNYGIVKNGFSCEYIYPVTVPEDGLELLQLHPKWIYKIDLDIQPDTFVGKLSFYIPFERGISVMNAKTKEHIIKKLEIYKPFITSVDLQTFSSIEGNTQANTKLQELRAGNIIELLKNYSSGVVNFNKQSSENWEEFFSMIENTPLAYLKNLSKEKIKEKLRSKTLLDSADYLLRKNRTALLTIGLKTIIDNNSNPYLLLAAYKKSIEMGDSLKAFTYQNKILEYIAHYEFRGGDLMPIEIPLTKKFLPHLTNYLAIEVNNEEMVYSKHGRDLALKAGKIDENYLPVKFNCCIMALKYLKEFNDTLFTPQSLEDNMNQCYKLGTKDDSVIVNHMWLNYSILSVHKNWLAHRYHMIDKHLLNIKKYYPGAQISEAEALKLGLLFNRYARYEWTINLLLPYIRNGSENEDLLFLLVETIAGSNRYLTNDEWIKYLKKARDKNKMRFYSWINVTNFQLLRNDIIKKEFCEIKL